MAEVKSERLEFDPRLSPSPAHSLSGCPTTRSPWRLDKAPTSSLFHDGGNFAQATPALLGGAGSGGYRGWAAPPAAHATVYSLFPGGESAVFQPSARYHPALAAHHKDAALYAMQAAAAPTTPLFHAPPPPPPTPAADRHAAHLELMGKGFTNNNNNVNVSNNNSNTVNFGNNGGKRYDGRCTPNGGATKRRWDGLDVAVKDEASASRGCGCHLSPGGVATSARPILPRESFERKRVASTSSSASSEGCSRTNPVLGVRAAGGGGHDADATWQPGVGVVVKKEPGGGGGGGLTPCQVAEVTTSVAAMAAVPGVKTEDGVKDLTTASSTSIPIGIAVARQRNQEKVASSAHALCNISVQSDVQTSPLSSMALVGPHCTDDRLANGLSPWAGPASQAAPTSTLWQYPALGVEPMAPLGYQLVREPMTGQLLLIPAASVLWPTYHPGDQTGAGFEQRILLQPQMAQPVVCHQPTLQTTVQTLQTQPRPNASPKRRVVRVKEEKPSAPAPSPPPPPPRRDSPDTEPRHPASCLPTPVSVQDASNQTDTPDDDDDLALPGATFQPDDTLCRTGEVPSRTAEVSSRTAEVPPRTVEVSSRTAEVSSRTAEVPPRTVEVPSQTAEVSSRTAEVPSRTTEVPPRTAEVPPRTAEVSSRTVTCARTWTPPAAIADRASASALAVDLSGLELLSNSIEQFERRRAAADAGTEERAAETLQLLAAGCGFGRERAAWDCAFQASAAAESAVRTGEDGESAVRDGEDSGSAVRSSEDGQLGGLGLLCALAEQRFMEEVADNDAASDGRSEPEGAESDGAAGRGEGGANAEVARLTADAGRAYKSREAERECRRFIASKVQQCYGSGADSPVATAGCGSPSGAGPAGPGPAGAEHMDAAELAMRRRLADLQRRYREKQRELSRLTPRRADDGGSPAKRGPGRPRKKAGARVAPDSPPPPPPPPPTPTQRREPVDKVEPAWTVDKARAGKPDILKPPTLTAGRILTSARFKPEPRVGAGATKPRPPPPPSREPGAAPAVDTPPAKGRETDKTDRTKVKADAAADKKTAFACSRPSHTFGSKPPARLPRPGENESMFWFKCSASPTASAPMSTMAAAAAAVSSSKKRKVGRPKKHLTSAWVATETIVSKKPRTKAGLVGFLMGKTRRLSSSDVPSSFKSANASASASANASAKMPDRLALPPCDAFAMADVDPHDVTPHKILPKLKAEAKVKTWVAAEDDEMIDWTALSQADKSPTKSPAAAVKRKASVIKTEPARKAAKKSLPPARPPVAVVKAVAARPPVAVVKTVAAVDPPTSPPPAKKKAEPTAAGKKRGKRESSCSSNPSPTTTESDDVPLSAYATKKTGCRCLLTEEHLATERLRALTLMGGLFYAGELSPIQPPDVYAIRLDGERGNKPHILTREEVLNDAILEVRVSSLSELPLGARVCAYWSQQYRCLYPGTVAPRADDAHSSLVSVEFDDGDNGRIGLDDIRLLPDDYPIVEYDPNPLLTLGRRRRQASGASCDSHSRRPSADVAPPPTVALPPAVAPPPAVALAPPSAADTPKDSGEDNVENVDNTKERKRLKKRRRDKLKRLNALPADSAGGRHRKKKHRCCDEHCRHRRHHRRHRKHKHRRARDSDRPDSDAVSSRLSPVLEQLDILEIQQTAIRQLTSRNEMLREAEKKTHARNEGKRKQPAPANAAAAADHAQPEAKHKKADVKADKKADKKVDVKVEKKVDVKVDVKVEKKVEMKAEKKVEVIKKVEVEEEDKEEDDDDEEEEEEEEEEPEPETKKAKKARARQASTESKSKMAAFLPARQLWGWAGRGFKRPGARGRGKKEFFKSIQRGKESILVGDSAVFLSTGRPDRPYIGRIESMWESWGTNMVVKVKWFYHPEETIGCPDKLKLPGALFESPHVDENDVQTISHRCEVLPLAAYAARAAADPARLQAVYDDNDVYYQAGYYDPTTAHLKIEKGVV